MALNKLVAEGKLAEMPMKQLVAAISVGMLEGTPLLDLCYVEDRDADVDMNVVMTEGGQFVEVQGSGEEAVFTADEMAAMLALAGKGIRELNALQREAIAAADRPAAEDLSALQALFAR